MIEHYPKLVQISWETLILIIVCDISGGLFSCISSATIPLGNKPTANESTAAVRQPGSQVKDFTLSNKVGGKMRAAQEGDKIFYKCKATAVVSYRTSSTE